MAKKSIRKVPSMVVTVNGGGVANIDSLCNNEVFSRTVFKETFLGIKDAVETKKKTAILFELEKSEYFIEIEKSDWKQALESCIDKFVEIEQYEKCSEIKELIDKIK
jgi:hydroxymethylpyrimidine pyrophosphatase-like HAD family hydrolase